MVHKTKQAVVAVKERAMYILGTCCGGRSVGYGGLLTMQSVLFPRSGGFPICWRITVGCEELVIEQELM